MELNHLKYFYEVVRSEGFLKASKRLHVSQPSVSKLVKTLEDHIGSRLIERSKRGRLTLTPLGRIFYERCAAIFAEVDSLGDILIQEKDSRIGEISIGASDNICNYLLPKLMGLFLQKNPKVSLKLISGTSQDIKQMILNGRVDFGMFYTKVKENKFRVQECSAVEQVIVYSKKSWGELGVEELTNVPYLGYLKDDYVKPYLALQILYSLGVMPKHIIETNNQETKKKMAEAGLGYAVLPFYMVEDEIKKKRLNVVKTAKPVQAKICLVTKANKNFSWCTKEIQEYILKSL